MKKPTSKILSPLGHDSRELRALSIEFLKDELGRYFRSKPPDDAIPIDYTLRECVISGLQFAYPMLPGNAKLYGWISSFPFYYPNNRWEYGHLMDHLLSRGPIDRVIDVGCGTGDFLNGVRLKSPCTQRLGVELFEHSAQICRESGHECVVGEVAMLLNQGVLSVSGADLVTSFHCLEHVGDPVEFVRSLLRLRASGGVLAISTPISPLPFEAGWFDVQNNPPHHLTRWNVAAYRSLAMKLNQDVDFHFGPTSSFTRVWLNTCALNSYGPHVSIGAARKIMAVIRNPLRAWALARALRSSWNSVDCPGAECVLVLMRQKH